MLDRINSTDLFQNADSIPLCYYTKHVSEKCTKNKQANSKDFLMIVNESQRHLMPILSSVWVVYL